jgi:hypothetical protein
MKEAVNMVERIKNFSNGDDHEIKSAEINAQFATVWNHLVCALLLQKLDGCRIPAATTYENAQTADKSLIALFSRSESTKLNPVITKAESIRDFGARCRDEQQYAAWARGLTKEDASSKESATDTDNRLFTILADNLPEVYRFLYFTVSRDTPVGDRFGALRVLLEGEAHKLKGREPVVSFADDEQEGHSMVALNSRLARDPAGKATSETCSESYTKNVETKFEPQSGPSKKKAKKQRKKASSNLDDSSSEEESRVDVAAIAASDFCNKVLAIMEKTSGSKQECFKFAKGGCKQYSCRYSHDGPQKFPTSDTARRPMYEQDRGAADKKRGRSPPPHNSQKYTTQNFKNFDDSERREKSQAATLSYRGEQPQNFNRDQPRGSKGGKGGKGKGGHHLPNIQPPRDACEQVVRKGTCEERRCRANHGKSATEEKECHHIRDGTACPFIWMSRGCRMSHKSKNA